MSYEAKLPSLMTIEYKQYKLVINLYRTSYYNISTGERIKIDICLYYCNQLIIDDYLRVIIDYCNSHRDDGLYWEIVNKNHIELNEQEVEEFIDLYLGYILSEILRYYSNVPSASAYGEKDRLGTISFVKKVLEVIA